MHEVNNVVHEYSEMESEWLLFRKYQREDFSVFYDMLLF